MFAIRRSRPGPGDVRQHARGRDHERRVARRERGELGERVLLGGITAHQDRRVGGGDVERGIDPRRATLLPRPHQTHEEAPVVRIRGIERSEVDARPPHDVRHPQRRIAGDRALQDDRRRALPRVEVSSAAVPVRVAVRVEAQAGARADLEQGDRPVDAAQGGQQRRAPQRFIRLQAADESTPRPRHRREPQPTPPIRGTGLPEHPACA